MYTVVTLRVCGTCSAISHGKHCVLSHQHFPQWVYNVQFLDFGLSRYVSRYLLNDLEMVHVVPLSLIILLLLSIYSHYYYYYYYYYYHHNYYYYYTTYTTIITTNITTTTTTSFLWPSHTYIHKYVDALPASISNVIWKPIHCAPLALLLAEILHSLKLQMINEYWVEKCWSSHGLFFKILIDNHEENEENHFDSWSSDQNWKWMPSRHK